MPSLPAVPPDGHERPAGLPAEHRSPRAVRRLSRGIVGALVELPRLLVGPRAAVALVRAAVAAGVRVERIPGPSAVIVALQVSGLPTDAFLFAGFLPPKGAARRRRLEELSQQRETVVVFESPHRIEKCLEDLEAVWGERPIALVRELTKLHEQVLRGSAREVRGALRAEWKRGEMVLVLGGRTRAERSRERADESSESEE